MSFHRGCTTGESVSIPYKDKWCLPSIKRPNRLLGSPVCLSSRRPGSFPTVRWPGRESGNTHTVWTLSTAGCIPEHGDGVAFIPEML
jgi:hypothetical protein